MEWDPNEYAGYIVRQDMRGAIGYVKQFPQQAALFERYMDIFERERYVAYEIDARLNDVLTAYQRYYRDAFYLGAKAEAAAEALRARLCALPGMQAGKLSLDEMERTQITEAFARGGLCFMGGKTGGYYGPYIWKTTQTCAYEVELPEGRQAYNVRLLDGFVTRSWLDYLSFGLITPGGWTGADGIISCARASYDLESERFRVSLLKHEAQHAMDLHRRAEMPSAQLEYRAKLVELIYTQETNLLEAFLQEADGSDAQNGHACAASRIAAAFSDQLQKERAELGTLPIKTVQTVAKALFAQSCAELKLSAPAR